MKTQMQSQSCTQKTPPHKPQNAPVFLHHHPARLWLQCSQTPPDDWHVIRQQSRATWLTHLVLCRFGSHRCVLKIRQTLHLDASLATSTKAVDTEFAKHVRLQSAQRAPQSRIWVRVLDVFHCPTDRIRQWLSRLKTAAWSCSQDVQSMQQQKQQQQTQTTMDASRSTDAQVMILEWCAGGDLQQQWMRQRAHVERRQVWAECVLVQSLGMLARLQYQSRKQNRKFAHNDLHLGNILVHPTDSITRSQCLQWQIGDEQWVRVANPRFCLRFADVEMSTDEYGKLPATSQNGLQDSLGMGGRSGWYYDVHTLCNHLLAWKADLGQRLVHVLESVVPEKWRLPLTQKDGRLPHDAPELFSACQVLQSFDLFRPYLHATASTSMSVRMSKPQQLPPGTQSSASPRVETRTHVRTRRNVDIRPHRTTASLSQAEALDDPWQSLLLHRLGTWPV